MRIIDFFSGARQVVYEAWFDIDGAPMMMDGDVYYGVRKEYDENGRVNVLKYHCHTQIPTELWLKFVGM